MNKLEVNQVGGFPMTTRILDEIQKAHAVFNSLGGLAGNFTIIAGCVTVGSTVGDGFVFINGEVFDFKGGLAQTKVIIKEDVENLTFQNGNANPVIKTRYVTFGAGVGAMDWVDFKRPIETKALEAMLGTINTSLAAIVTKLNTIETNAKVQLQSDFNQTDNTKKDYIKNIPGFINYIHKGAFAVGDNLAVDTLRTVTFPDVGTNNYMVVGCMVSVGSNFDLDNDVIWMIREKANTSFKLTLREVSGNVQNLSFEYMLIPL
jgi:hypothetical protein